MRWDAPGSRVQGNVLRLSDVVGACCSFRPVYGPRAFGDGVVNSRNELRDETAS